MENWYYFFRERLLPPYFLFLAIGIAVSGQLFVGGVSLFSTFFCWLGLCLFFVMLNLIEDVKNYDQDRIGRRDYPLPQGIVSFAAASAFVYRGQLILFAYCIFLWFLFSQVAAFTFALAAVYLWHIYKSFYLKEWFVRHPMLRAWIVQLFTLPIALFSVSMADPAQAMGFSALSWALLLYSAFIVHELCSNLDPLAHPILVTYTQYYGYHKLFVYVMSALLLSVLAALFLSLEWLLWPVQGIVLTTLVILYFDSHRFKLAYYSALVLLMAYAWVISLNYLI